VKIDGGENSFGFVHDHFFYAILPNFSPIRVANKFADKNIFKFPENNHRHMKFHLEVFFAKFWQLL